MRRTVRVLGGITGCLLTSSLLACGGGPGVLGDQGPPGGAEMAKVAEKCRRMDFDLAKASVLQGLNPPANTVMLRIIPATRSSQTKLSQLVSKKGRIIARVVNDGTDPWPAMALAPKGTSCWYVWGDNEERMRSKFVALDGTAEVRDPVFDIEFHPEDHLTDSSEWNPPARTALSDRKSPFQLAAYSSQPARVFNTGWTTCLINGCCRSRQ